MKKLMRIAGLIAGASLLTVGLGGCDPTDPVLTDQCLRQELFKQCMSRLPKGPERVGAAANDWQEVVAECGSQAYYQAKRKASSIKPECAV